MLFDAADGVRKPTAYCEAILAHVHEIALRIAEIGNIGKAAHGVVGRLRIASTSSIAEEILAPNAGQFLVANPGLTLQFMVSDENVNFSHWEADLALRYAKPDRGDFTIAKLADVRLYLFEPVVLREPGGGPVVCCYPEDLDHTPESRYLMARQLQAQGRCITGSLRVVRALIKTYSAVGVLPEYMCADLLDDAQLRATPLETRRGLWLLIQNHLKRDPAARAVIDWVRDSVNVLAPVISG